YPSFVRYDAAALLAGTELVKVPLDSEWRHDLPAMAEAITPRTKLVFIANPNNPTGTVVRKPEFEAFLDKVPSEAVVVLDEAYGEFAEHLEDYPRAAEYVRQGRNVVGLRTFSKAHGLAGIRIGYGFASETICDAVDRAREPFNVNSLAHAAATAALDDKAHLQNTVEVNRDGIVRIKEAMAKYGHRCIESFANFICVDIGRPAQPAFEELLRRGVIVRSGVPLGMPTCLRITIGTPEEVGVFLEAMEDVEKAKV
ncbi:MAG: pyridoxal phosphate-dependent aminotransferase, partial [Fimbriimonadaceae bacterium]